MDDILEKVNQRKTESKLLKEVYKNNDYLYGVNEGYEEACKWFEKLLNNYNNARSSDDD